MVKDLYNLLNPKQTKKNYKIKKRNYKLDIDYFG